MRKIIIGVMGPGDGATEKDKKYAYELGQKIAENGWVVLSGGRNAGVMDAVSRGAKEKGGLVVGILPSKDGKDGSEYIDIAIISGIYGARNFINILSSNVVIACGMGAGTASEVSFAIKFKKHVILLTDNIHAVKFFQSIGNDLVHIAKNPADAISQVKKYLGK